MCEVVLQYKPSGRDSIETIIGIIVEAIAAYIGIASGNEIDALGCIVYAIINYIMIRSSEIDAGIIG